MLGEEARVGVRACGNREKLAGDAWRSIKKTC